MGNYDSERQNPIASCSATENLVFDGNNLIFNNGGRHLYPAVSGKPVNGKFIYTVARQQDKALGPIPAGDYWIDPSQLWTRSVIGDILSEIPGPQSYYGGWGEYRITIHQFPTTNAYSRGGFFIHGGTHIGSAGCIHVLNDKIENFVQDMQADIGSGKHCLIKLKVAY